MKKLLFPTLFFILSSFFSFSQIFTGSDADKIIPEAELVRVKEYSKVPSFIRFSKNAEISTEKALTITKRLFEVEKSSLLQKNVQKNKNNELTIRYFQAIDNVPIEFTNWLLQVNNDKVFAMNGELLSNPNIVNSFSISEEQAFQNALNHINAKEYMWEDIKEENLLKEFRNDPDATYFPNPEKVYIPKDLKFSNSELFAAYKFDIYAKNPHNRTNIYIDANTGEVLMNIQTLTAGVEGTAITAYSGEQTIITEFSQDMYRLFDDTRGNGVATYNCQNTANYNSAVDFVDDDNYWDNFNDNLDEYATDAHFATASTYDYFYNIHGRNSIDGNGLQLISYVHFNLIDYGMPSNVNAFWNGEWMTYGDGDQESEITPLTTVDICGHEITHGLTSYTCNLVYQDEPGSLNEAFSDIFGAAVEFYAVPQFADWTIGEDIGLIIRSMENPKQYGKPDTYLGENWVFGTEDYGGVHTNNGPLCYWFYLLSEGGQGTNDNGDAYSVEAIGIEKVEQIAFRLQTVYLTETSEFYDAWFLGMQATKDLYGDCSFEMEQVGKAFHAIGVAEPYQNQVVADFTSSLTSNCEPPLEIQFLNRSYNGSEYLWDFGDGNTSTEMNPTHVFTDFGNYDVSLTTTSDECGENTTLIENYVVIDDDLPCVTIMPTSGITQIQGCSGYIYDHGGPDGNYLNSSNSRLTISSDEAENYILVIHQFDIEEGSGTTCDYDYLAFYDGETSAYPLINGTKYCNSTGNPEIIYSTGNAITIEFYSDQAVAHSGFEIEYYCLNDNDEPFALFDFDKFFTCDGLIEFTDQSLNNPNQWLWDFGDGNSSELQNPTHRYSQNGVFTVSLTVYNDAGEKTITKEQAITVNMPDSPSINDSFYGCNNTDFNIDLGLDNDAYWYENLTDSEPVFIGNIISHPALNEDKQYYIKELNEGETFLVGEQNNTQSGDYFGNEDYVHYLIFDAYVDFKINSVKVNAQNNGVRQVALRNSNGEIIVQKNVFMQTGVSVVELDIDVPAGENLQLVGMGAPNLFRTNSADLLSYPYEVDGVVSIKASSATANPTNYYYYFYDWNISTTDCQSEPIQITVTANDCENSVLDENVGNNKDFFVYPNPNNGLFYIEFANQYNDATYEIYDVKGKLIANGKLNQKYKKINLDIAPAVYYLKINRKNSINVEKLIIK